MRQDNYCGTLFDYLKWRGDLTFDQSPFQEIDSLILSELAYVNFDNCFLDNVTLHELAENYKKYNDIEQIMNEFSLINQTVLLLLEASYQPRFQNIIVSHYQNIIDYKQEKQFSALNFYLPNHTLYISFRGTDDTVLGWKEDFNMTFKKCIPSQENAIIYLQKSYELFLKRKGHIKTIFKKPKIIIGGHSKGGNLAIYSAIHAPSELKKMISRVDNFDGPGFHMEIVNSQEYQNFKNKIITFKPEGSIIGSILDQDTKEVIVKSFDNTMMQHSGLTWQIQGNQFCVCESLNQQSQQIKKSLHQILDDLTFEQREEFVNEFFDILADAHIEKMNDLTEKRLNKLMIGMKGFKNMQGTHRNIMMALFKCIIFANSKYDFTNYFFK